MVVLDTRNGLLILLLDLHTNEVIVILWLLLQQWVINAHQAVLQGMKGCIWQPNFIQLLDFYFSFVI
jgi:hypothetical protein